ncbi:MAG: PfkB family carbohydrate kinase [Desulfobacterales bacterium]|jgi:sugar/nucleoside kinase (ribokinase family)
MTEKGIAVIGSTTIDRIIYRDDSRLKIGGVTLYSGTTYSRHGINTIAITNIAACDSQLIERLENQRIFVYSGSTHQTTHFINDIRTEKRCQKNPARAASISRRQIWDHLDKVNFLHLGPLHPDDIDVRAIQSLKALDLEIILDIQGLVRKVRKGNVYPAVSPQLSAALGLSQIVKANKHEYATLLAFFKSDLVVLMRKFDIREFIVTLGAMGGFVQKPNAAAIPYEAAAVKIKGDPTGAGDIFLAAYAVERLIRQHSIDRACEYAAQLVARQIEGNYIKAEDLCISKPPQDIKS